MLNQLTAAQEAMIPVVRQEWLDFGLCTEKANRPRAEAGVRMAYESAGLQAPLKFIWRASPMAGCQEAARFTGTLPRDQVNTAIWSNHDASWLAFYDFFNRCGLTETSRLKGLMEVAKSSGWWWAFETTAILTERPCVLHRDQEFRLHNETGMALEYPDGFGIYAVHGVRVPGDVVLHPENQTIAQIKSEPNAEIKRIRRERFGQDRYLAKIKATLVNVDSVSTERGNPQAPEIMRALIQDDENRRFLVGSDGSTDRVYYMEVPGIIETCREAHAFLSGFDEAKIISQS